MSSTNRSRKGHQSSKIPNVKLRPAPPVTAGPSRRAEEADDEDEDGLMGPRAGPSRKKVRGRERSGSPVNMMDRALKKRLYDETAGDDDLTRPPSLPFKNLIVCFTGLASKKSSYSKILITLGAKKIESNLTVDVAVLVGDAAAFGGAKYLCALEHRIPVVTPEWIIAAHEAWLRGEEVDAHAFMETHRLKAFDGLRIAVSGIEPLSKRKDLQTLIESHAGTYSPTLDRTCTHLIVSTSQASLPTPSRKVEWALELHPGFPSKKHGVKAGETYINVVWEGWVWDCVAFKGRWAEGRWDLRSGGKGGLGVGESWVEKEAAKKAVEQETQAAAALLASVVQSDATRPAPPVDTDDLLATPAEALEPAMIKHKKPELAGFPGGGKGAGKRGGELVAELLGAVKVKEEKGVEVEVEVKPVIEGLGKGEESGSQEDSQGRRKRPKLALVGSQPDQTDDAASAGPSRSAAVGKRPSALHTSRATAFTEEPVQVKMEVDPPAGGSSSSEQKQIDFDTQLFRGLVFSYITYNSLEGDILETALKRSGGTVRGWEEVQEKGEEGELDYLVVRVANGPNPTLPKGARTQVVTECWVERCLSDKRVCAVESNMMFRPLKGKMPIPGAHDVLIHLSGMTTEELFYSKRLLRAFGAQISTALTKNVTTHMVVCDVTNERKIRKSLQWKIPVVKQEWLFAMAESGKIEPFEPFVLDVSGIDLSISTPVPSGGSANSKTRLSVDTTGNLSAMSESVGPFGVIQAAAAVAIPAVAPKLSQEASLKSSTSQRQLGLTPTEVNIPSNKREGKEREVEERPLGVGALAAAGPATERILNNSQSEEKPVTESAFKDLPPALTKASTTVPVTNPFRVNGARKQPVVGNSARSTIPDEMFEQLARVDANVEEQRQKPGRPMRRPVNGRKASGLHSRSVMQTGSPSRLSLNPTEPLDHQYQNHEPMDVDADAESNDDGEESIRVQYMDPTAEKERKRLLDALTGDGDSTRSSKRRRAA